MPLAVAAALARAGVASCSGRGGVAGPAPSGERHALPSRRAPATFQRLIRAAATPPAPSRKPSPSSDAAPGSPFSPSGGRRPAPTPSGALASPLAGQGVGEGLAAGDRSPAASSPPHRLPAGWDPAGKTVGVLLLNLGGPETLDDVQPFLYNLFSDDSIIRLPGPVKFLQRPLAQVISTIRAPKSAEGYRAIGGGSPLLRITNEQAAALGAALSARGVDARVYVGMRYWRPFMEDAVAALQADGVTDLIVLPLYPQFSISTSGSSLRLLEAMMDDNPAGLGALRHAVVSSWYWREGYLSAMAGLIGRELAAFPDPDAVEIFFSAHGVPVSYVRDGDPYQAEMEDCVDLIMDRVRSTTGRDVHHTLAYQSRVGPVEWLTPYTDVKIRELAADGCKALLAVPVSFVSEHIETLEEIDVEYRELAESVGITQWRRVPALNTEPLFIDDLAALVIDKLPACAQRPGYAGSEGGSLQSAQQRAAAGLGGGGGSPAAPADKGASMLAAGEGASLGPPTGTVRAVLKTYDRERRTLPPPSLTRWAWGWTRSAETWNGRIAMVAILAVVLLEAATGEGVLARWLSLK